MHESSNPNIPKESKFPQKLKDSMDGGSHPHIDSASTRKSVKTDESHEEGVVTKAIENQTSKIPSVAYLGLAFAAMLLSAGLAATSEKKGMANFVGLWAPSILLLGIYNKIVKTQGSDNSSDMSDQLH